MSRRVVIAPYPFKGTMTSAVAAEELARRVAAVGVDMVCERLPLGDGGAGTLDALVLGTGGEYRTTSVYNAIGDRVPCRWGIIGSGAAVIEAAECIGLAGVPAWRRDPSSLTTRGIGELILAAVDSGCREILISLGDTATHDCGIGAGHQLGYRFLDAGGHELEPVGASLGAVEMIEVGILEDFSPLRITLLCDVLNPLLGSDGAALRFSGQKGADVEAQRRLEEGSERMARLYLRDLGRDVAMIPGAGAAGGLGAGLTALCGAVPVSGARYVLDALDFDAKITGCDLVITGEGRVDAKTLLGKGVGHVAERARRRDIPCLVVAGVADDESMEIAARLGVELRTLSDMAGSELLRRTLDP